MLHWSFDYSHNGQQPYFAEQLGGTLGHHYESAGSRQPRAPWKTLRYASLSNFWYGFSDHRRLSEPGRAVHLGTAELTRAGAAGSTRRYTVESRGDASGERLRLEFGTAGGISPVIADEWSVTSENTAGYLYRSFASHGYSREENGRRTIHLVVNGTDVVVGSIEGDAALICNWSLFDPMPTLARGADTDGLRFALFEDLEKIRLDCRVARIGPWTLPLSGPAIALEGFCVHGNGLPPTYWWVDQAGDVVIVSSLFQTLVLQERLQEESPP